MRRSREFAARTGAVLALSAGALAVVLAGVLPVLLPAFADDAAPSSQPEAPVRLEAAPWSIAPGATTGIQVTVHVDASLHVMANPASEEWLVPLQLTLDLPEGWEAGPVSYPPGEHYRIEGMETALLVYEGAVPLSLPVSAPAGSRAGNVTLSGTLSYQGCTQHACLIPAKLPVELRGRVRPDEPEPSASATALRD